MQSPGPKTNLDMERLAAILPGDLSGDTESPWKRLCIQQDLLGPTRAQALRTSGTLPPSVEATPANPSVSANRLHAEGLPTVWACVATSGGVAVQP